MNPGLQRRNQINHHMLRTSHGSGVAPGRAKSQAHAEPDASSLPRGQTTFPCKEAKKAVGFEQDNARLNYSVASDGLPSSQQLEIGWAATNRNCHLVQIANLYGRRLRIDVRPRRWRDRCGGLQNE